MKSEYLELSISDATAYLLIDSLHHKDLSDDDNERLFDLIEDVKGHASLSAKIPIQRLAKKYLSIEEILAIGGHIERLKRYKDKTKKDRL